MTAIPGWAYLIIGGIVAGFSKFVEAKSGKTLTLFIFIGIVFAIIGIIKILVAIIKHKIKQKHQKKQTAQIIPNQRIAPNQQTVRPNQPQQRQHTPNPQIRPQQPLPHTNIPQANFRTGNHHIQNTREEKPADHPALNSIILCQNCGVKHYSYAKFCMMCGNRMK